MFAVRSSAAVEAAHSVMFGVRRTYKDAGVSQAMESIAALIEESTCGLVWEVEMEDNNDPEAIHALGFIEDLAKEIRAAGKQQAG